MTDPPAGASLSPMTLLAVGFSRGYGSLLATLNPGDCYQPPCNQVGFIAMGNGTLTIAESATCPTTTTTTTAAPTTTLERLPSATASKLHGPNSSRGSKAMTSRVVDKRLAPAKKESDPPVRSAGAGADKWLTSSGSIRVVAGG